MQSIEILGFIAATLTTIAFIPQVIKIWRTKSTKDISLGMFIMFCTGILLWLFYGIFIKSLPVIFANIFTLILALIILFFKIRYK